MVRLLRRMIGIVTIVCACASVALAQVERGEIRISVADQTGLPVGASGTLASEAPQLLRPFTVDAGGRFALQDLPFGVYRLIVERPGFVPYSTLVEVRTAVPRALSIQLSLASVSTDVTVTDERPLVDTARAGVTFSIGVSQIQDALPAVPGRRMLELVDSQPGWLMEANGVLHPRGSEYQTLFVIDGVPMDENRSPAFAPDLQEGELQGMSVLTGNFPAEIRPQARRRRRGHDGTRHRAWLPWRGGRWRWQLRHGVGRRERALRMEPPGAVPEPLRCAHRSLSGSADEENFTNHGSLGGVTAAYDEQLNDANRLRFTWHHRTTDFLVPNERLQEEAGQRQERAGHEDLVQGTWMRFFRSRFVFNARGMAERIGATLDSNQQSTPIIVSQDRSLTRGFVNASVAADLGRHQVKFGGDVVVTPVSEALEYTITNPAPFPPGTAPSFTFDERLTDREQSLFAQDTMRLGSFTVSAGLRLDHYAFVVNDTAVSPRLGIAWARPDRDFVIRASYDRAFQTPAVENLLLASSGQTDAANDTTARLPVLPSRGNFIEAGITAGVANRLRLDVTAYNRSISQFADDDVFLNTGVSFPVAFDSAHIRRPGCQADGPAGTPLERLFTYSLLEGTARLPVVGGLFIGEDALAELEAQGEVAITQDQRHTVRGQLRFTPSDRCVAGHARCVTAAVCRWRFEGEADEAELAAQFGEATVAKVDFETGRVHANFSIDVGARREPVAEGTAAAEPARGSREPHQPLERDQLRRAVLGNRDRCPRAPPSSVQYEF